MRIDIQLNVEKMEDGRFKFNMYIDEQPVGVGVLENIMQIEAIVYSSLNKRLSEYVERGL